jgi:hypothetical protein
MPKTYDESKFGKTMCCVIQEKADVDAALKILESGQAGDIKSIQLQVFLGL